MVPTHMAVSATKSAYEAAFDLLSIPHFSFDLPLD